MDVEMLLGCETAVVVFDTLQNCFLFAFFESNKPILIFEIQTSKQELLAASLINHLNTLEII